MIDHRHKNQVAAGERDVGGNSCPLGSQGFLGYLDEDFLPFVQEVLDMKGRGIQVQDLFFLRKGDFVPIIFPGPHEHFQVIEVLMDIRDVEESGLFQADVYESGLHPGKNANDPALINIAGDPLLRIPLHIKLHQGFPLQEGNSGFSGIDIDQDFIGHESQSLNRT
jgi:hypothetical protein